MKRSTKKIKGGFKESVLSIIIGFILTLLISTLVGNGWIPDYSLTLFTILNVIGNILTLNKMRFWGLFYTIGWMFASLAFVIAFPDLLSTLEIVLNIMAPVLILFIRFLYWIRGKILQQV
jgi:hypothetical protein